jgi:hypothetical protein
MGPFNPMAIQAEPEPVMAIIAVIQLEEAE